MMHPTSERGIKRVVVVRQHAARAPRCFFSVQLAAILSAGIVVRGATEDSSQKAEAAQAPDKTAEQIATLPGFRVELVLRADRDRHGSFISLSKDDKGRLLLGTQRGQPMTRLTISNGKIEKEEVLKLPVSEIMGTLWLNDSLYVNAAGKSADGKEVYGLFRLRDSGGDAGFASVELLREWRGGAGEHGAHTIVLGPDGKHIYIVCGNFVEQPKDLLVSSPHRNFADDRVLPRTEDGNGFGAGMKPPGGSIFRMDLDGKNCELYASGERNTYGIAFNADGELFGFDSDMEWDWGTPWYRPIRVFHAPSGADQGFREGSAKWPEYYEDSLPAAVDVGLGSPTGVVFGAGAKFPARYQKSIYVLDWTYGRLIATHLRPNGSSYDGTWENFVAPKSLHAASDKTPLNLTGVVIGADGAMYFTTGGRGTQGYLFRVTYTGGEPNQLADLQEKDGAVARALRHKLEAFHGRQNPAAVETAWPHLASDDRFLRYAARLAVESQPIETWRSRALNETRPQAAIEALLALSRLGGAEAQASVMAALAKIPLASLTQALQVRKLRVLEVSIARQGKPSGELSRSVIAELDPLFPSGHEQVNRELCQILLDLDAPGAVAKTMNLLTEAPTQEEQLHYVLCLRTVKAGWTLELRKEYFSWFTLKHDKARHPRRVLEWFTDAGRDYGDGASYRGFLSHIYEDAVKTLSPDEVGVLEPILSAFVPSGRERPAQQSPPRPVVKQWTMADLEPALGSVGKGRSFLRGREALEATQCLACHKLGNEGGASGPDLTAVSSRFTRRDILESIIDPSKVLSEQYANSTIVLKDGEVLEGRIVEEAADKLVVQISPLRPERVTVKKADVESRGLSKLSPMPQSLVDVLSQDEILDVMACLESGGNRDHAVFK